MASCTLQVPDNRDGESCGNTRVRCQDEFFKMIQDDALCLLPCEQDTLINCEVIMQGLG